MVDRLKYCFDFAWPQRCHGSNHTVIVHQMFVLTNTKDGQHDYYPLQPIYNPNDKQHQKNHESNKNNLIPWRRWSPTNSRKQKFGIREEDYWGPILMVLATWAAVSKERVSAWRGGMGVASFGPLKLSLAIREGHSRYTCCIRDPGSIQVDLNWFTSFSPCLYMQKIIP